MKYITTATEKRIKKLQKEWIHTSMLDGEKYGAFIWNACEILKDIMVGQMNWCGHAT